MTDPNLPSHTPKPVAPEPIVQVKASRRQAASQSGKPGPRPKAERPRRQWPLLVGGLLAVLALAGGALLLLQPRQQVYVLRSYEAAAVTRGNLTETETVVGSLGSADVRPVAALSDAAVQTVRVQAGQTVVAGQLLMNLSSPDLDDARIKARDALLDTQAGQASALRTAQNALTEAQLAQQDAGSALTPLREALRGVRSLYAVGGVPRSELEGAQQKVQAAQRTGLAADNKLRSAQAALDDARSGGQRRVQAARDDLTRAERALKQLELRAPIAGRVVELNAKVGQRAAAGSALLSVASLKAVTVQLQLGETLAGRVKVGQSARITVGTQTYPGEITRVASTAVSSGGQAAPTVQAEAAFKQLPANLRLGSSASVEVRVADHANVLTLPRAAFLSTGNEALAYVLSDGKAVRREVSFGAQNDSQVEVKSGLAAGERVITSSYEAFKDQPDIQAPKSGEIGQNASSTQDASSTQIDPPPGDTP